MLCLVRVGMQCRNKQLQNLGDFESVGRTRYKLVKPGGNWKYWTSFPQTSAFQNSDGRTLKQTQSIGSFVIV